MFYLKFFGASPNPLMEPGRNMGSRHLALQLPASVRESTFGDDSKLNFRGSIAVPPSMINEQTERQDSPSLLSPHKTGPKKTPAP